MQWYWHDASERSTKPPSRVAEALRRYEELRAARTARIVRQSRRIGQVGQLENPLLCRLRDRALAMIPSKLQLRQLEEVVGHEV